MIISDKQQDANRRNAQQSTGPKTPEGREAVRLNALKYGLRARSTVLPSENLEDFERLCAHLEAEWQPQTRTEWLYLETMATSQWLLARVAVSESHIYQSMGLNVNEKSLTLLQYVSKQRAHLERSFRTAIADLKQSQKERQSRPLPQPAQAAHAPAHPPAQPAAPPPAYRMQEGPEAHPAYASSITPDSR
jgi:hypothetical protein